MERYENGKIYRLIGDDGFYYIGSTCLPLYKRLHIHKRKAKKWPDRKVYKHFAALGWEKVKIVLIEDFSCNNKDALCKREQEVLEQNLSDKCLNTNYALGRDEEKQSISNKRYEIKRLQKVECPICGRLVAKKHLNTHQQRPICK